VPIHSHIVSPRHLLDVWNPSYASNAMEAHLAVLLTAADRFNKNEVEDEPHVWWGKIRSVNRQQQELKHLPQILQIAAELDGDDERECNLYLTDYRSLYVGQVDAIVADDVRKTDPGHVPSYYAENSLECDFWYRLLDLRRLVADDTTTVISKLRSLRNLGYGGRPVSLYGGMVDLPLIVERADDESFFSEETREAVTDGRLWAEADAEAVGVGTMERELRENLFGDDAWLALDPAARTFLASAERIFRDQRSDPGFDYGPVVTNLAKALEVTCNAIIRRVSPKLPRELRTVVVGAEKVELGSGKPLSVGQLARLLGDRTALHRAFRQRLENGEWLVDTFPKVLGTVAGVRNPAAHSQRISREAAGRVRSALMGIGCQGAFVELAKVRMK
jgi:hypothetical protein